MANIYAEMGQALRESFNLKDERVKNKKLNESRTLNEAQQTSLEMLETAFNDLGIHDIQTRLSLVLEYLDDSQISGLIDSIYSLDSSGSWSKDSYMI